MQQVTIKDIARLAGVSVTTVSRALNEAPEIREETREKVLAICREQGYRTNLLARSLISSRTNMLGLILPDIANPFHAVLSLHIETFARELGYQVMLCSGRPGDGQIESLFDFLISQRVDGILLTSSSNAAYPLLQRYQAAVPCVLLGAGPLETGCLRFNSVSTDNYVGGYMAAEALFALGHREIVYLGRRRGSATHDLRHNGFLSAAATHDMSVVTVENPAFASSIESGYRTAREFFLHPFSQTALFSASDAVALGAMQAADELGISIPDRLSVLGFDNIEYAALPNIQLSTIAQNSPALARSAVHLLLELIENGAPGEYTRKLITPSLIQRATCRPPSDAQGNSEQ